MQKIVFFIIMFVFASVLRAQKQTADSLYISQHYQEAAALYETLLVDGVNADVYYNLANAYYRMNDVPRAVLNYERALKVSPNHEDARYNLELCHAKLGVAETYTDEYFFSALCRKLLLSMTANAWMGWCYALMVVLLSGIVAFCLVLSVRAKKLLFLAIVILFFAVVVVNTFAYNAKENYLSADRVVVMNEVQVYEGPTKQAKSLGQLVPGATYQTDIQQGEEWIRLILSDGSVGWCERVAVEFI